MPHSNQCQITLCHYPSVTTPLTKTFDPKSLWSGYELLFNCLGSRRSIYQSYFILNFNQNTNIILFNILSEMYLFFIYFV